MSSKYNLSFYRLKAAENPDRFSTWREYRQYAEHNFKAGNSIRYSDDKTKMYIDSLDEFPSLNLGDAHEIAKLGHTGWYADNFQDALIRGAVVAYRDPRKLYGIDDANDTKTHLVFLAATYSTNSDGATIYTDKCYTAREAALAADHYAEREAEKEREYQAQASAEYDIEEAKAEIHRLNKEFLELSREAKQQTGLLGPRICQAIRDQLHDYINAKRKQWKIIKARTDNFWTATPGA